MQRAGLPCADNRFLLKGVHFSKTPTTSKTLHPVRFTPAETHCKTRGYSLRTLLIGANGAAALPRDCWTSHICHLASCVLSSETMCSIRMFFTESRQSFVQLQSSVRPNLRIQQLLTFPPLHLLHSRNNCTKGSATQLADRSTQTGGPTRARLFHHTSIRVLGR